MKLLDFDFFNENFLTDFKAVAYTRYSDINKETQKSTKIHDKFMSSMINFFKSLLFDVKLTFFIYYYKNRLTFEQIRQEKKQERCR